MNQSHSLFVLNSLSKKSKFQKIEFLTFLSNLKPKNHASDFGKKPDFLNSKICKNLNALDTRLHIYMPHRLPNEKCLTIKTRNICLFLWPFCLGCSQQTNPIGFTTCQLFVCTNDILLFTISISTADPL